MAPPLSSRRNEAGTDPRRGPCALPNQGTLGIRRGTGGDERARELPPAVPCRGLAPRHGARDRLALAQDRWPRTEPRRGGRGRAPAARAAIAPRGTYMPRRSKRRAFADATSTRVGATGSAGHAEGTPPGRGAVRFDFRP